MIEVRRPLAGAIAWTLLAELVRRHADQPWHILELHPGGGQYDLLTLWSSPRWDADRYDGASRQRVALNLLGSAIGDAGRCDWLGRWLEQPDPASLVDVLERLAGLPHRAVAMPTSREVFGIRLIAALCAAHAFDRYPLDARMMWADTSGDEGGLTDAARQLGITERREALCWWLLSRWPTGEPVVAVRVDGLAWSPRSDELVDLYPAYLSERDVGRAVRAANELVAEG